MQNREKVKQQQQQVQQATAQALKQL